jgi:hypothetical protein
VNVEAPVDDFSTAYQYDTHSQAQDEAFPLSINLADVLATMHGIADLRSGYASVSAELRAVANLSLSLDAGMVFFTLTTGETTTGDVLGDASVIGFPARAELWLTMTDVDSAMTFRAKAVVCPPFHAWSLDTPGLSGSCAVSE